MSREEMLIILSGPKSSIAKEPIIFPYIAASLIVLAFIFPFLAGAGNSEGLAAWPRRTPGRTAFSTKAASTSRQPIVAGKTYLFP